MMDTTLNYYNQNAVSFAEGTKNVEFKTIQDKFTSRLPQGAAVLDFGCGSGRDTKYFKEKGFCVTAVDGSEKLCKIAEAYAGVPVRQMMFLELDEVEAYDGIWACSSILHCSYEDLVEVMKKISMALKDNGVLYTSFKYGTFSGERGGRFFTDMTEETFRELLQKMPELEIEDVAITTDVRPGREEERWLNLIVRKRMIG